MNYHIINNRILIFFTNVFLWGTLSVYSFGYQDPISLDPAIRYGKLTNGLTYYIKATGDGSSQMNTYLLVKSGIAHEDPDQYEQAHFLEHMAFKAGSNMTMAKAHGLGFKMGEINGSASFDLTQYYVTSINTRDKLSTAFQLFQDIIWDLDLKEEYINSERSVVINEKAMRGAFQANSIMVDLENWMLGRGAKRPDDLVEYINTFPPEPLKRYYRDWYRPDLMAIVVVGDIKDLDDLETEIKAKFSREKHVQNPRSPIQEFSAYRNAPPQFIKQEHPFLSEDSKNRAVYMRLYMRQKNAIDEQGLETLKNEQCRQLLVKILKERFGEEQNGYGSNFHISPEFLLPSALGLKLHITIEGGEGKEVLLKTIQVLKQLERNGYTKEEFRESKRDYLRSLSKIDTTNTSYWWSDIRDHFVYGKVLPADKKGILRRTMSDMTLSEFNKFVERYIKTQPQDIDIILMAPPGHPALSYSEKTIRKWIAEGNRLPIQAHQKPKVPTALMAPSLIANLKESTIEEKNVPLPGTTEYLLGNGVRIVINSPDSTSEGTHKVNNRLRFHGFISKGVDDFTGPDFFSALNSVDIIKNSGAGGLDKLEMKRYLEDKDFKGTVYPYIEHAEAGIKGSAKVEDLETALQLVYLYFTAPNKDTLAFEDWKLNTTTSSHILKKVNADNFRTEVRKILGDSTFLPLGTKALEGVSKTDMDRAYGICRNIFGNAAGFTFIFTGDFPEDAVLSLCRKYLGNLPAQNIRKERPCHMTSSNFILTKPRSVVFASSEFMQEVQVELVYTSALDSNWGWKEDIKLLLLRQLMDFKISQLRFKSNKGGSYDMGVGSNLDKSRSFNEVFIRFSCSPRDVDRLIRESLRLVAAFKKDIGEKDIWERNRTSMALRWKEQKSSGISTAEKIYDYYQYGTLWVSFEEVQTYLESLSKEDVQKMAQKLLKENPFEFKMVPSKSLP